ncbi:MAG TPA: hypothetical protein VFW03_12035 [Gemmatimonadaceae bacterium]|nr:hypothetical protein [Gemmatimonadaceae bacterium]
MVATTSFTQVQAPCGRLVDGETYQDRDEETLLTLEVEFACGCRTLRHEYHDGSVSQKIIRHDGHVLVDEMFSAE